MAIALVGAFSEAHVEPATTVDTGTRTTSTGNFVVGGLSQNNQSSTVTLNVSSGALTNVNRRIGGSDTIEINYRANITGATNDFIRNVVSSGYFMSAGGGEFSGVKTTTPLDVSSATGGTSGAYTSGTTASAPSVTTTAAGDLVIGAFELEASADVTATQVGSWAILYASGHASVTGTSYIVYQIVGAAGSYTPQIQLNQSGTITGVTAAFLAATGGGGRVFGRKRRYNNLIVRKVRMWLETFTPWRFPTPAQLRRHRVITPYLNAQPQTTLLSLLSDGKLIQSRKCKRHKKNGCDSQFSEEMQQLETELRQLLDQPILEQQHPLEHMKQLQPHQLQAVLH